MLEEVKIAFYKIERCGYYRYNHEQPEFGSIDDTLDELIAWTTSDGCVLGNTCTYEVEESDNLTKTYCFNVCKNESTGDFILVTWNSIPSVDGKIPSVNGSQPVGSADVNMTEVQPGDIPGYATYFWFVPSKNVFSTVCFHHPVNGHKNMRVYLHKFLSKFTNHVVSFEAEDGTQQIEGYAQDESSEAQNLRPRFVTRLYRLPARLEYLRKNRQFITKIIRKNSLLPSVHSNLSLWQSLLVNCGIVPDIPLQNNIQVKYEFGHTPTEYELDSMIQEWEMSHDTKWDDIGFAIKGETSPFWLSHSVAKNKFELDVERDNEEIVNPESLLEQITSIRPRLLRLLGNE